MDLLLHSADSDEYDDKNKCGMLKNTLSVWKRFPADETSTSLGKDAFRILKWLCQALPKAPSISDDVVELVAILAHHTFSKQWRSPARRKICRFYSNLAQSAQEEFLKKLYKLVNGVLTFSIIANYWHETQRLENMLRKDGMPKDKDVVDWFLRTTMASKQNQQAIRCAQDSASMLQHLVTEDLFRCVVLPAIQKALLRSPETTLGVVGCVLRAVAIDMNSFAVELAKLLITVLRSQSEDGKTEAIVVSGILASKVTLPSSMLEVLEVYFGVLSGAEGKLTTAGSKLNILKAIKNMSDFDIVECHSHQVASQALERCIGILEAEVHDGTILECLDVMRIWAAKLGHEVPPLVHKYMSKTLANVKGTLRFAFFCFVASVFDSVRAQSVNVLMPTIDKWLRQNLNSPSVSPHEGLPLLVVLVRIRPENKIPDDVISVTKSYLDEITSKNIDCCILSSKYLLEIVSYLDTTTLNGIENTALDSSVHVLTRADYEIRRQLKPLFKELLLKLSETHLLKGFLPSLIKVVKLREISGHITEEIIRYILQTYVGVWTPDKLEQLTIELIWLAHGCHQEQYWITILKQLRLPPKELIEKHWTQLNQLYITGFDQTQISIKVVRTCVSFAGTTVSEDIVKEFFHLFRSDAVINMSEEEYAIFLSKPGELYDTSVLQRVEKKAGQKKDEIKPRQEFEDKGKKAGKGDFLTQKQKEVLKVQMDREAEIRERIRFLDLEINRVCQLLLVAIDANVSAFERHLSEIVTTLLTAMRSPIASSYGIDIFKKIGTTIIEDNNLGDLISHITVAFSKPICHSVTKNISNTELEMCTRAALVSLGHTIESKEFSCGAFSYCFPLFNHSSEKWSESVDIFLLVIECIILFLKHLNCADSCYINPVPRVEMCKLLYKGFLYPESIVQQKCLSGLLELSKSCHSPLADKSRTNELQQHVEALLCKSSAVRDAGIRNLAIILRYATGLTPEALDLPRVSIYRAKFDEEVEIRELAEQVWNLVSYLEDSTLVSMLLRDIYHSNECIRSSSAKAMYKILQGDLELVQNVLEELFETYDEHLILVPAVVDSLGRVIEPALDRWEGRHGVGCTLKLLTPILPATSVTRVLSWILKVGIADKNADVRNICLDAAVEVVNFHGKQFLAEFVVLLESNLEEPKGVQNKDSFKEACVILMGCLASHLDPSDLRVKKIFSTLIDTLSTPSEKVQEAVANCIPALVPSLGFDAVAVMSGLLTKAMESNTYGERRGAAYGLAGLVKGMGILSLKQNNIMNILAEGMQDKKNYRRKEGCLMALELLCNFLGRLFEPYIVHVLPHLLQCLGDPNVYVREATENTAKCLMSRLSGHGVKLVLPALLNALNEDSWRTKCGSVDLLGRMAYCAPKQLSGCLPMIVPHLIEVLSDSHVKVQESAAKALGLIGSVIRNPEIQAVVPILLEALEDPSKKTHKCMQALLKTEFVHFVDPPSLALIMPVVQRAFQDRSTETRRMASQIIGNMYSLTDHSDLIPYMASVMPGLKTSLTDPVPEVRSVAAKALGSMAKGLGEKCYDEILPWLMKTLVSETSSVDRSGAAQGLAEVIGALGNDKLQRFMPEIIRKADSDEIAPYVRDGYMMMFIYMPSVFEEDFIPYIGQILNPILKALADENEFVRDTALRAGQRIVAGYADTAITLLLPELEKGIFDDNWRIRFSSVQLLGDLLYKISGVSGKMSTESSSDDDNFGTEQAQRVIVETLGLERRNRVLAGLYIERSDVALMVRQAALHVWKVVVANTPKTLREILKTLFSLLLGCLASSSHDKRQVAARTLGDLVRKLGDKILPEILPLLEKGLESPIAAERQGVCVGLSEIMTSTSREMVLVFVDNLVPTLRKGLCDSNPDVRATAAVTFSSLHTTIGSRALDEIIPYMLKKINDPNDGDDALYGLGQLVLVRSKSVMPYVIPHLLTPTVNLKALAVLSSVSGEAMSRHLPKILPTLLTLLKNISGNADQEQEVKSCGQVILSITDEDGVRSLISELLGYCTSDNPDKVPGVLLLSIFCIQTKVDLTQYIPELLRGLILQMVLEDTTVLKYIVEALAVLIKNIDASEQPNYVGMLHQSLRFAKSDLKNVPYLPGLCVPKGINSVLPLLREALLNGPTEIKEAAAHGMNELINLTSPDALKPAIILITGPLIRILGDRYGPNIKVAVIETLTLLLQRVGLHLKAFLPQLQTTFLKGSIDPNRSVRLKASSALVELIQIHPKPDPLFLELANAIKTTDDSGIRETALSTLRSILDLGSNKMNETTKKEVQKIIQANLNSSDKSVCAMAEDCLGYITRN